MNKVKIGIIGTGVGIRTHLSGFRLIKDAEVIAICGSTLNRSKEFAQKYDIPIPCADYKALCDLDEVDLVCITTPNRFHSEMVSYALMNNKNIICEKPLSDNIEEVKSLIKTVVAFKGIAIVNHQLRFNPYIKEIKRLIDSGKLGKVYFVKLNQQGTSFANDGMLWNWSFDGNAGGGVRLAMASHFTDLMQYWFNSPEVVSVNGYLNPVIKERVDDKNVSHNVIASTICMAQINFVNELVAQYSINAGSYVGSKFDICIYGEKGEMTFSLQDKLAIYLHDDLGIRHVIDLPNVYEDEKENKVSIFSGSFRYFAPIIIEAIQKNDFKGLEYAATFKDAEYNISILNAIKNAANTGCPIAFKKEKNDYV